MAALQTLRNKAAVAITILISLALLAFILTDLLGSSSIFGNSTTVGVIDGNSINIQDFEQELRASEQFAEMNTGRSLNEDEQNQNRENLWNKKIMEITFGNLYEAAGVDVTPEELLDMAVGNHIAPYLRQLFTDPQTNVYNREAAQNFLRAKNQNPQYAFMWTNIEKDLKANRLSGKYMALLRQGTYCNKAQVEVEKAKRAQTYDVNFVNVRYALIPDSTIEVSNSEIKARYNKDKENFKTDESRDIEYISFTIRPTDEDRADIQRELEALKADFAAPETNANDFAQMNAETPAPARFLSAGQLPAVLADFVKEAKTGDVCGPYLEGNAYKISRIAQVAMRPDSVKARHILIRQNEQLADSLLAVVKNGGNFAEVARQYSEDPGSAINGGDLGWFADGMMVPEFNEACFNGTKGAIVKVQSQFGFHIINIQDRGVEAQKYQVATIDKSIRYSSRTNQAVYSDALGIAANIHDAASFNAYVDSSNVIKRVGRGIRSNARTVNSVRRARDLVKWAFNAEVGEVSGVMPCEDEYIIAVLTKEQEKGYVAIEEVSPAIAQQIRNEKKAAAVAAATAGMNLAQVADLYKTKVDTAHNVSFAINSIPGAGIEPALVGKVASLEQGKVFSAVKGNNGAYVLEVAASSEAQTTDEQIKAAYMQQAQSIQYALYQYVTDVDIEDNRIKFY